MSQSGEITGEACSSHDEDSTTNQECWTHDPGPWSRQAAQRGGQPSLLTDFVLLVYEHNLRKSSFQGIADFMEKAQKNPPPEISQVTGEKTSVQAPKRTWKQLQQRRRNDLKENALSPQTQAVLDQGITTWKQRVEEEEGKERLVGANARRERATEDKATKLKSLTERLLRATPRPRILGHSRADGSARGQQGAGTAHSPPSVPWPEGDLRLSGVTSDCPIQILSWSLKEEPEKWGKKSG